MGRWDLVAACSGVCAVVPGALTSSVWTLKGASFRARVPRAAATPRACWQSGGSRKRWDWDSAHGEDGSIWQRSESLSHPGLQSKNLRSHMV